MKSLFLLVLMVAIFFSCTSNVVIDSQIERADTVVKEYIPMVSLDILKEAKRVLIPFPQKIVWGDGEVEVLNNISKVVTVLTFSDSDEAYSLNVDNQITIEANSEKGFFYAMQTLNQLTENNTKKAPICYIEDYPAYKIRGVMHDTGRNFQTIEYLKEQMKRLSAYKLNTFHWHITDNPGFRLESIKYPILNDPKTFYKTRKPGLYYTYAEVIDFIKYCQALNINVIIEIDMPGHSKYFPKAFLTKMYSKKGTQICVDIINEFCEQIPYELAPIIHIGTDEVRFSNPEKFAKTITDTLRKNGRGGVVWAPGIESDKDIIRQVWASETFVEGYKNIDSSDFYISSMDYFNSINRVFFKQICGTDKGDDENLGGIMCNWNDVAIADEKNILRNNPFYLTALTGAEVMWLGNPTGNIENTHFIPEKGTVEFDHFSEFEDRLIYHKNLYFKGMEDEFFYKKQSDIEWSISDNYGNTKKARGISVMLNNHGYNTGVFPNVKVRDYVTATRTIYSETEKTILVRAGFDVPHRPHRFYGGIPPQGKWDCYGSEIRVNGEIMRPPVWENPRKFKFDIYQTWDNPIQETPWTAEEIYWRRTPVEVKLNAGENIIEIKSVKGYKKQNWMFGFWILE